MSDTDFCAFSPIPRLRREMIITEKLDGTNAQLYIEDVPYQEYVTTPLTRVYADDGFGPEGFVRILRAGSRNRWLTPEDDNFGFAAWAYDHAAELLQLGPGRHFGEWWGYGIQRHYNLQERRFSLFNANRWGDDSLHPKCCSVVPMLFRGIFDTALVDDCINLLRTSGSRAAPGFMNPEGVIIYHASSGAGFKCTLDGDEHKGKRGKNE